MLFTFKKRLEWSKSLLRFPPPNKKFPPAKFPIPPPIQGNSPPTAKSPPPLNAICKTLQRIPHASYAGKKLLS